MTRAMLPALLEFQALHGTYATGGFGPVALVRELLGRIAAWPDKAVFISLVPEPQLHAEAAALEAAGPQGRPLYGIPYVVKDNIDVAGMPTTAACPDFAYIAARDATCVARLRAAGALLLGKVNLDQFATGLNGTRSPYGAPRCVFNPDYISGGSSSGSAVSVAAGLAAFALGTDTAGSGRVPAGFNNIVGLKPSIGRIPAAGMVNACKSLDCISIFANSTADAMAVLGVAQGGDPADAYARPPRDVTLPARPRIGILPPAIREFHGDEAAAALYEKAIGTAATLGCAIQEFDYTPFRAIAAALYGSALAAERIAAIPEFYARQPAAIDPAVRAILDGAAQFSAADAFIALHEVQALRRRAEAELAGIDLLLLPTAPDFPTIAQMRADPLGANERLGLYTNFVNLLDLAAIAIPAGFRPNGLPFGVTLIGQAFSEAALAAWGDALHHALGAGAGVRREIPTRYAPPPPAGQVQLVVAGAHLSGMALNHELTSRGGTLLAATATAPDYRLFALDTIPAKPGLARAPGFMGPGIAVELWSLTAAAFGDFVASLPPPMGIGKVTLADGSEYPGFLCEAHALETAQDITRFGGWRAFRAAAAAQV